MTEAVSGGRDLLPIACTLGPDEGAARLAEWQQLGAIAGAGREHAPGRVTLRFRDLPGVGAELERLVAAERACCAFLGWHLVHADAQWHVEVSGSDEELQALPLDG